MDNHSILDSARLYASLGWRVLPVLGKVPRGEAWQDKAANENVDKLFTSQSSDGVGVLLGPRSGIIDVDCDSEEAENNLMVLFGGEIPNTPQFKSKRGSHFIFKWREGLPEKAVFKLDGIEFRIGNGGKAAQTVFPPSGGRTWENDCQVNVIEFPHWEKVLKRYAENQKPKKFKPVNGSPSPRYGDGETLNVPRWLAKHGKEIIGRTDGKDATRWHIECPGIALHTTKNAWRDCCVTQKDDGTLGGLCLHQSCGMSDWANLRDAIGPLEYSDYHEPQPESGDVDISGILNPKPKTKAKVEPQPEVKPPEPKKDFNIFPADCLEVPGLIGQIMAYNARTVIYPRTELALAGALALMSAITGRKIADRWGLRTNAYFVGLCNSGGGKAHAKQINSRILGTLGKDSMIMPKPKSGSGLVSSLRDSPASLLQVDELADWLEIMKNPQKSPHTYEILGLMKEVYSEAKTESWKPAGYADAKKNPVINSPHLSFYGVAPMQVFWQSLTKQNLTDGLVGRLLTIESTTENISNDEMADESPPESLLKSVATWLDFTPGDGNLNSINYRVVKIQHTSKAWDRYREHGKRTEKRRENESEEAYAIWCRTPEKTGKLAMLRACSRVLPGAGGVLPTVELEDVEWAIRLSNWVARTMIDRARLYVSENQTESSLNAILRLLDDWRSMEWIGQKIRGMKRKEREEILRSAVADEMVEQKITPTAGKPKTEFRRLRP